MPALQCASAGEGAGEHSKGPFREKRTYLRNPHHQRGILPVTQQPSRCG